MAQAAIHRGLSILAITDHSGSLGIANGLSVERLHQQRAEIEQVQEQVGDKVRLLHGAEVDILADGTLDYDDDILAWLDIVIASLHSSLRQPREVVTGPPGACHPEPQRRYHRAYQRALNPQPRGGRPRLGAGVKRSTAQPYRLRINASPYRLDIDDVHARRAVELGIPLSINTDAHSAADMDLAKYGVAVAERAWVKPEDVLNTWADEKLVSWLKNRTS